MTNQQVINFLGQARKILLDDKSWIESAIKPINEAFDLAISALEKQDVPDTNVGDTISRQAAIDCFWNKERFFRDALDVIKDIRQLPPAKPEITEEAVKEYCRKRCLCIIDGTLLKKYASAQPEAAKDTNVPTNAELPPAQPEQRWTPVAEGLPKAGVRYQVTFASGEVGYADFRNKIFLSDGSVKENIWEIERYYEEDGEVIAWKPLSEPYKEMSDVSIHS